MALLLYRLLQIILAPLIILMVLYRLLVGREDRARFGERLGHATQPRPEGQLVWMHGASVGEVNSLTPVLHYLRHARPGVHLLLTTGTRNGLKTLERLAPTLEGHGQVILQYVPLDVYPAVRNFLTHWQPNLSVFVESEFWPELIHNAPHPMLLNGKISDRSWPRYQRWAWVFRKGIARYEHIVAQREADAQRLRHLGGTNITVAGNLKFDAPPLTADDAQLQKFRSLIGSRPTVVVASTHPTEEEEAAQLHLAIKQQIPDVLTIIIPRHPHRGTAASNEVQRHTRNVHRRGVGEVPHLGGNRHTDIYIADTLGELGLWYRLADVAVVGGSLIPHGGHNPIEPLKLGVPTCTGPHMFNFQDMIPLLTEHNLIYIAENRTALAKHIVGLLTNRDSLKTARTHIATALPTLSGSSRMAALALVERLPLM